MSTCPLRLESPLSRHLDLISFLIQTPNNDEIEVLPNGEIHIIPSNDQRKALLISDIKHAGEANSSYSSEVTLYAVLLSNWLRLTNLDHANPVSAQVSLWTRAKEISSLANLVNSNPGASIADKVLAFNEDLEEVDYRIFFLTY